MATGYTHNIPEGISLRQFMLQCVRAMGVCMHMRDEPMGKPIPNKVEPSRYHEKALAEAEQTLAEVNALTKDEIEAACEKANKKALADWEESTAKNDRLLASYQRMLEKVTAWVPPTPQHENFKKFMVEQITSSIGFDCHESDRPVPQTPSEWLRAKREYAEYSVKYHRKNWAEDQARAAEANEWLKAFWNSLPPEGA